MKIQKLSLLLLVGVLLFSACQTATGPQNESPAAPQPQASATAYPLPEVTEEVAPTPGGVLYPDLQDGQEIYASQAVRMIKNGEVAKVVLGADFKVFITLKDGRVLLFYETSQDNIYEYIKECGDLCKDITVTKE